MKRRERAYVGNVTIATNGHVVSQVGVQQSGITCNDGVVVDQTLVPDVVDQAVVCKDGISVILGGSGESLVKGRAVVVVNVVNSGEGIEESLQIGSESHGSVQGSSWLSNDSSSACLDVNFGIGSIGANASGIGVVVDSSELEQ